jgi:hypothetical protein
MAKQTKTTNQKPSHDVFHVVGEGETARWTRLGAAWQHRDGEGFNLQLNFVPVTSDGRFVVRKVKPREEAQA